MPGARYYKNSLKNWLTSLIKVKHDHRKMKSNILYRRHRLSQMLSTRVVFVLIVLLVCCSIVMFIHFTQRKIIVLDSKEVLRRIAISENQPILLLWTKIWGQSVEELTGEMDCILKHQHCQVTSNREAVNEAAAVVFHARDVSLNDLPSRKFFGQPWVLWNHEAPSNSPLDVYKDGGNFFDIHMSYRRSSEIYSPYGFFEKRPQQSPIDSTDLQQRFQRQIGAAWLVSDCSTESNRESYVSELQEYFPVEIYGRCGKTSCTESDSCMGTISDKFMFYLSFENSMCTDYVTEKLFRTLNYPIIPIVMSGPRDPFLDSLNAFVDASHLTPRQLATKLDFISRNISIYKTYFDWKTNYTVKMQRHPICMLCDSLRAGIAKKKQNYNNNIGKAVLDDHKTCSTWDHEDKMFVKVDY